MHIHGAAIAKEIKAPDLLQQLFPGEYPVLMSGQKIEHFQLFGGHFDELALEYNLAVFDRSQSHDCLHK